MVQPLKNKKHFIIAYHILDIFLMKQKKLRRICERFYKDIDINITFSSLRFSCLSSCKETLPKSPQSYIINQFTCANIKPAILLRVSAI